MKTAPIKLNADFVFAGGVLHQDAGLQIENGVARLVPRQRGAIQLKGTISGGFVDLQVNGGGGVLFNNDPTPEGLLSIAEAHRTFGTTSILPTVISDAPEVLKAAATAVLENAGANGILGLHIEGPHIAMARRGTHHPDFVRPMDDFTMSLVAQLRDAGHVVMITVAPEACQNDQIAELVSIGAIVSIGHSDSDANTVADAIVAGATCGTHLFNAMSQMTAREPGVVGALLGSDAYAAMICDGHHVDDAMIALALRAHRRPERLFLVSDAMATVGGPDEFKLYGQTIRLQDGRLVNAEGNLAGAHVTQLEGLTRLVQNLQVPLQDALRMVTTVPASLIRRPLLGLIDGRRIEDLILLDDAMQMHALTDCLT